MQQHGFNLPYQMSHASVVAHTDTVAQAQVVQLPLQRGDVLLLASDGLFDNLFEEQILSTLQASLSGMVPTAGTLLVPFLQARAAFLGWKAAAVGPALGLMRTTQQRRQQQQL